MGLLGNPVDGLVWIMSANVSDIVSTITMAMKITT
jgi:hypothetical protein